MASFLLVGRVIQAATAFAAGFLFADFFGQPRGRGGGAQSLRFESFAHAAAGIKPVLAPASASAAS